MRLAGCLLVLGACTYGEPDVAGGGFKCDSMHACPADQYCIAGTCDDGTGVVFANGWERRIERGCDQNALVDRDYLAEPAQSELAWNQTPPFPALCSGSNGNPDAEIIEDLGPAGTRTRMLQVRQSTGHVNGTDFYLDQTLSGQPGLYAWWWVKYSADWQWSTADHGIFKLGDQGLDISFGVRGHAGPSPAFVSIYVAASDTRFDSTVSQISAGVWHFCVLHVVAGMHGKVEAWVDDVPVPFVNEQGASIVDINTGMLPTYAKLQTAYNDGAFLDAHMSPAAPWFMYYDDVRIAVRP